jgi:CTP:molybdopterin cytidylyltransferase MocA
MRAAAVVLAAGAGRRMGQDKALIELGGRTAIERVVHACVAGGAAPVVVVRAPGAAPLPAEVIRRVTVVLRTTGVEMIDSLRAGMAAVPEGAAVVVFPVDYALVGGEVVAALLHELTAPGAGVALPLWEARPGHPIALAAGVAAEIGSSAVTTLRDVVVRDTTRVRALPAGSPWIVRDLDTPEDLAAARAWLAEHGDG